MIEIDPSSPEVERGFRLLNGAKVRFPSSPLEIKLYYGRHGNEHELDESFSTDLRQADLFCFESIGWEKWQLELTQRVADGSRDAADEAEELIETCNYPDQADFARKIYKALLASNARVHFPDVPKNHAYFSGLFKAIRRAAPIIKQVEYGDSPLVSDIQLKEAISGMMTASVRRDRYVLEHFFPKDLEPKPLIRVVGFFGLMHSITAQSLARAAHKENRDDIRVVANTSQQSDTLLKFLNSQPIDRQGYIELIRYWLET
jgi:hypothetical protein